MLFDDAGFGSADEIEAAGPGAFIEATAVIWPGLAAGVVEALELAGYRIDPIDKQPEAIDPLVDDDQIEQALAKFQVLTDVDVSRFGRRQALQEISLQIVDKQPSG